MNIWSVLDAEGASRERYTINSNPDKLQTPLVVARRVGSPELAGRLAVMTSANLAARDSSDKLDAHCFIADGPDVSRILLIRMPEHMRLRYDRCIIVLHLGSYLRISGGSGDSPWLSG